MLKVIIADDEARVCSLIHILIDWDALGLELAGTASNGVEALELLDRERADILITDIRMPGLSGLELIERAKAVAPKLEIVIISGYAHFEYAQQAIRFGVSDYLLKPINQQQINDTLMKLAARCRDSRSIDSEMEVLRKSSEADARQLQSRLMQDLLSGALTQTDPKALWEKYRFRPDAECFQLVLLQIDYDEADVSSAALRIVEDKAASTCRRELAEACPVLLIQASEGPGVLLLGFPARNREEVRKLLRKCLHHLCAYVEMYGSIDFSMAVSPVFSDVRQLGAAFQSTRAILAERLVCGTGRILDTLPPLSSWKTDGALKPYRQALNDLPQSQSGEAIARELDLLEEKACGWQDIRGEDVYDLILTAARLLHQQPQVEDGIEKSRQFAGRIAHIGKMKQLFSALKSLVAEETKRMIERQRSVNTRPIRQAQDYVQRHYRESITLEKVCEEVGFSVSYFSSLYKKETGENFLHYLTRVRIDRARDLLVHTSLPVSEICALVGYSDLKHFTQTFRKETELSPGQYRKLYG